MSLRLILFTIFCSVLFAFSSCRQDMGIQSTTVTLMIDESEISNNSTGLLQSVRYEKILYRGLPIDDSAYGSGICEWNEVNLCDSDNKIIVEDIMPGAWVFEIIYVDSEGDISFYGRRAADIRTDKTVVLIPTKYISYGGIHISIFMDDFLEDADAESYLYFSYTYDDGSGSVSESNSYRFRGRKIYVSGMSDDILGFINYISQNGKKIGYSIDLNRIPEGIYSFNIVVDYSVEESDPSTRTTYRWSSADLFKNIRISSGQILYPAIDISDRMVRYEGLYSSSMGYFLSDINEYTSEIGLKVDYWSSINTNENNAGDLLLSENTYSCHFRDNPVCSSCISNDIPASSPYDEILKFSTINGFYQTFFNSAGS